MHNDIQAILQNVKAGSLSVEDALVQLKQQPFEDLSYAKVDLHRKIRQGASEVIYGAGKTVEQITGILNTMAENGQKKCAHHPFGAGKGPSHCCHPSHHLL